MFKVSSTNKQKDIFSSPEHMLGERELRAYEDPLAWHNLFYRHITSQVDETIFRALYKEGTMGAPTKQIRMLVAMMILKEGTGCSDQQLYEHCRFNLLWRAALGLVNLSDTCPSLPSYYDFKDKLNSYAEAHPNQDNLFTKCFEQLTSNQMKAYNISGKTIRMDSKLISSHIAWYSRYELIHKTFQKCVVKEELAVLTDDKLRQTAEQYLDEEAQKVVYLSNDETIAERLLTLGVIISQIVAKFTDESKALLARVFVEQYEVSEDGTISLRDKRKIPAASLQNPNDPDATYREKAGKKTKGYTTNITETCEEDNKPNLIANVQVEPANHSDNSFFQSSVEGVERVTGNKIETAYSDGAYQSEDNRQYANENDIDFMTGGLQGKQSKFELDLQNDDKLIVTDKKTAEVQEATKTKSGKWKITTISKKGKQIARYFTKEMIDKAKERLRIESVPWDIRKKRNNVEATIFQYCLYTRNNKTRYRTLFKHTLQAVARCAWINVRRLYHFEMQQALQIAK